MDIEKTIKNLSLRGFDAVCFDTGAQAADYISSQLQGAVVGIGGSMTVGELGLYERLKSDNTVYWHLADGDPETAKKATAAPVYITSANAVSENGEIINIDGRGNRVAATLYNKDKVYIIVGINKITPDFESAVWRARNIAAPQNAKRLGVNTPCAANADKCYDCRSTQRVCGALVVLWSKLLGVASTEVVIIGEELGM